MDFEMINKLFLELSQVTTATTAKEVKLRKMIEDANGVLRSAWSIAERDGGTVNWDGFRVQLKRVLDEQHRLMYPETYKTESA